VTAPSPFCQTAPERVPFEDRLVRVLAEGFPVSPGHTPVAPVRNVASFFELNPAERAAMVAALEEAKRRGEARHRPAPRGGARWVLQRARAFRLGGRRETQSPWRGAAQRPSGQRAPRRPLSSTCSR
jgi:hypothetical protein